MVLFRVLMIASWVHFPVPEYMAFSYLESLLGPFSYRKEA